jgi:hypothetical protein
VFGCRPSDEPADDPIGLTDLGPCADVMERIGGSLVFNELEERMRHSRTRRNSGSASYVFRSIERGFVGFIHLTI